jgi:hypothetical protein
MKEFKHKITFAAKILPVDSNNTERILSFASKNSNLSKLLPKDVNLTENIGFQLFESEAFLINKLNLNSDGVQMPEGAKLKESAPLGFIDLEHSRKNLVGVIVDSKYTDIKTGKEISAEVAEKMTEPLAVTITGIIWCAPNPELADAIKNINESTSELKGKVYCSWEVAFDEYNLLIIDKNKYDFAEGKLITDQKEINELSKKLLAYGGNGFTDDGKKIGRVPIGEVVCLGVGLVENPAGQLDPIVVKAEESNASINLNDELIEKLKNLPESGMGYHICDIEMNDGSIVANISIHNCSILSKELNINEIKDIKLSNNIESFAHEHKTVKCSCGTIISQCRCMESSKNIEIVENGCKECLAKLDNIKNNISQANETDVITNNEKNILPMKIDKIEQLTDENLKEINSSGIKELFASSAKQLVEDGIKKISEDFTSKIAEKDNAIKAANENAEKLNKSVKEIQENLEKVTAEHNKLLKANQEREQLDAFSARMESIENSFDLDDKQKEIVANKVKTLASDDEFNAYLAEIDVLLAAKKKSKKAKEEDAKDGGKDDNQEDKDGNKKEAKASVDDALKNGEEDKKNLIPNAAAKQESLAERAKKAFGVEGWEIVDKRKNRK